LNFEQSLSRVSIHLKHFALAGVVQVLKSITMSNSEEQSKEAKAVETLKEVYQDAKNSDKEHDFSESETSAEETKEQVKGSDADIDERVGGDDQSTTTETAEQEKGSDADTDDTKQP
jgi:hypothetical protein